MTKYVEHSIREECKTNKDIVTKIFNNAFSSRNSTAFSYRPFQMPTYADTIDDQGLNFAKIYPHFNEGDYVYIQCCMDGMYEREMMLLIQETDNPEVSFNGEKKEVVDGPYGKDVYVNFNKGRNYVLIKVTAKKDSFAAYVLPVVPGIRYIACGEYQYRTWQYIEKDGAKFQEGFEISRLYSKEETPPVFDSNEIEWVYPIIPEQDKHLNFNFAEKCSNGKAAYVYTSVNGKIKIRHSSPMKILSDSEEVYFAENGEFVAEYNINTPLLIKSINNGKEWGFVVEECERTSLPFVTGSDSQDLCWLWIGPFGKTEDMKETPYGPEKNLCFNSPYASICEKNIFWQFYREKTYLKPYNHTAFFGQWYYAIMVGHYYMLEASKKIDKSEFIDFYIKSIGTMCKHRDYSVAFKERFEDYSVYLSSCSKLDRLDPIGTIGMNVAEYYMMTADDDARYTLEKLSNAIKHNVPRFPDGTFYRGKTMWTDDTYMSLPFLARLGLVFGDDSYFKDIVSQVRGFVKRMYMTDSDLFSHIFFTESQTPNRIPWGRGNGWVLLALSEVLLVMPENYDGREEILELFAKFSNGIMRFRDENKCLWHQVINNPNSYIETSGSAMFIIALARGIRNGWIENSYTEKVLESWEALCENCIDTEGNIFGVCKGSSCSMEEEYYLNLETMTNDDHGVGIVLGAGVEIMNLESSYYGENARADLEKDIEF